MRPRRGSDMNVLSPYVTALGFLSMCWDQAARGISVQSIFTRHCSSPWEAHLCSREARRTAKRAALNAILADAFASAAASFSASSCFSARSASSGGTHVRPRSANCGGRGPVPQHFDGFNVSAGVPEAETAACARAQPPLWGDTEVDGDTEVECSPQTADKGAHTLSGGTRKT